MKQKKSQIAKDIFRRVIWLYVIFFLLGITIALKIAWLQYGPQASEYKEKARNITFERVILESNRGDILARDGRTLATSVPIFDLRMDFAAAGLDSITFYSAVDSLSQAMSSFFRDKSATAYRSLFVSEYRKEKSKKNRYKQIAPRKVSYLEQLEIAKFPLFRLGPNRSGFRSEQTSKRIRPHGSLAMRTIGLYVHDSLKYGIDGAFNNQLRGEDGSTMLQRISGSFKIPVPDPSNIDPVDGSDVVTTLDVDLQDVAETALKNQLRAANADWGTVVLMEVKTGEIHAMANLTRKSDGSVVEEYNYAIGRRIEPGSTFKLATLIALLEDGEMSLDDMIDCENGSARVGMTERTKRLIRDTHKEGVISLRRVFEVSSNVGMAKAANSTYGSDPKRFVNFINSMGFDKPLGVQIAGESNPLIKTPGTRNWDGTSLVMMAQGYALEITPMHTLALYNAVANGGQLMRPQLVKEIRSYGQTTHRFDKEVLVRSICSEKTIALVRSCLEGVVDEGTGRVLRSPYYTVAAKTGTAQIAFDNGGYIDSRGGRNYLGTMVGYFPADNPKYSCIVAIKTYNSPTARNKYYGAVLSGPVFKAVADRVYASNPTWHSSVDTRGEITPASATQIKSGKGVELKSVAKKLKVPVKIERSTKEWVYTGYGKRALLAGADSEDQSVGAEEETRAGIVAQIMEIESRDELMEVVPSVVGMGLKDAIYLLERQGLKVAFRGQGEVVEQSVRAGTKATKGDVVVIRLEI